MCYDKIEWEKAGENNNGPLRVPSNRKEEIKSGASGCGSFVVPYFQPAASIDCLRMSDVALALPMKYIVSINYGNKVHAVCLSFELYRASDDLVMCDTTAVTRKVSSADTYA